MTENPLAAAILSMKTPFTWSDIKEELARIELERQSKTKISDLDIEIFLQGLLLQGFIKRSHWKYTL
jgi:hypothetical protein